MVLDFSNNFVIKGNSLVNASFSYSRNEQKVALVVISLIDTRATNFKSITLRVLDLANTLSVVPEVFYRDLTNITNSLLNKPIVIYRKEEVVKTTLLTTAVYNETLGTIEVVVNDTLKPYLLQQKGNFTKYNLKNIVKLKSKYSIRMYEILMSHAYQKNYIVKVSELKTVLGVLHKPCYQKYADFKRGLIEPVIDEINALTDIRVTYKAQKSGRKIDKLIFTIDKKQDDDKRTFQSKERLGELTEKLKKLAQEMEELLEATKRA